MFNENVIKVLGIPTVLAMWLCACGAAIEQDGTSLEGESDATGLQEAVDSVGAAQTLHSGCEGQYLYRATKRNNSSSGYADWGNERDLGREWHMEKSDDYWHDPTARERARRKARDAIATCGKRHYATRWDRTTPAECSAAQGVSNYPFSDIKNALETDVIRNVCGPYGRRNDVFTVSLSVKSDGKVGCLDHYSWVDDDGGDHTEYYPSIDLLTSTYDVACP